MSNEAVIHSPQQAACAPLNFDVALTVAAQCRNSAITITPALAKKLGKRLEVDFVPHER